MKNVKNEPKKSSSLPLVIIALVLIAALGGGWWLYNSSQSNKTASGNRAASNSNRSTQTPVNAPPGAQPPNMLGAPNAVVTVEEFADFQCGACASVHPTMKEIQSIYGPRIKFVFRHFPLAIPGHDKAYDAAVAAEAAGMQGKFWAMQNELFMNQQAWSTNPNYKQVISGYAQKIGLDADKFATDMAGIAAKSRVDADRQRGMALGVNSTPSVYINNRPIPFPEVNVTSLRQIIDTELQRASAQQSQQQPANAGAAPATAANAAQ